MDNMSLGYNFQSAFKARVSFTVQNVFTITKYKGLDPEVNGGIDNNFYPRPRVFVLGVNLSF
jgi:iron complex outermembrane receptor protein